MNYLFVYAHKDDETFLVGGVLAKLSKDSSNNIRIVSVCSSKTDTMDRDTIFRMNEKYGVVESYELKDQQLDTYPIIQINNLIEKTVNDFKPDVVFTHANSDINKDHRIVHNAVIVACRPNTSVKCLYTSQNIDEFSFGEYGSTEHNICFELDKDAASEKITMCNEYNTEIKDYYHPRNIKTLKNKLRQDGSRFCVQYAEVFNVIYQKL